MFKKTVYKVLNIITLGRGIKRTFENNVIRMPTRFFRYFPNGYEKENFCFINEQIKPGMNVLDVGAHIGLMTVIFGKKVGDKGSVYAFEPTPTTIKILRETIKLNKINNISTIPAALADKKGKLTFYISENAADNSNSLVNNHRTDRKEEKIEVEVNTIDDFIAEKKISRIDFIKIDVEGAELKLLKGAAKIIKKDRPKMILSIHPEGIKNFGDSAEDIWKLLHDAGYKIVFESGEMSLEQFTQKTDLFDVFLI
jgi:FkbM family methyltransferase